MSSAFNQKEVERDNMIVGVLFLLASTLGVLDGAFIVGPEVIDYLGVDPDSFMSPIIWLMCVAGIPALVIAGVVAVENTYPKQK